MWAGGNWFRRGSNGSFSGDSDEHFGSIITKKLWNNPIYWLFGGDDTNRLGTAEILDFLFN